MSGEHDPLAEAQSNAQRMAIHAEQSLGTVEWDEALSHVQEALRYGEMARAFIEEAIDSTADERVILHGERALESIEEALDQASQALFASEATVRRHTELMSAHADRGLSQLSQATGRQAA